VLCEPNCRYCQLGSVTATTYSTVLSPPTPLDTRPFDSSSEPRLRGTGQWSLSYVAGVPTRLPRYVKALSLFLPRSYTEPLPRGVCCEVRSVCMAALRVSASRAAFQQ